LLENGKDTRVTCSIWTESTSSDHEISNIKPFPQMPHNKV